MKRILKDARCVTLILASLAMVQPAYAVNEWFEFYNNSRSLAMGGSSIAITSDDTAVFRNPANLGNVRDFFGTIIDPEVEGTSNLTPTQVDIKSVRDTLITKHDTFYRARMQVSPALVTRNIGIGLLYKDEISAEISSDKSTVMDTHYVNDMGVALGANVRLFDGRIKLGVTTRAFNRIEVNSTDLSVSGPTDLQTIGSEGTAIAFDAGMLIQFPWKYIPTLGVVVRDMGDTVFDKQDGFRMRTNSRPAIVKQSVDAAVSLFPIHSGSLRSVWTLEYQDATNSRNDSDTAKRIHAGVELNVKDVLFIRAGYNQRYVTGGIELASENIVWQITTYGEEIGTESSPREDRRINTKFTVRF